MGTIDCLKVQDQEEADEDLAREHIQYYLKDNKVDILDHQWFG